MSLPNAAAPTAAAPINEGYPGFHDHLSEMPGAAGRDDADECVRLFLGLSEVSCSPQAEAGRLLRFLLVWFGEVPAGSSRVRLLRAMSRGVSNQPRTYRDEREEPCNTDKIPFPD